MTLQELLKEEELLCSRFLQMLLVEHYSRRLDYIKKKKIELDEYIVEDCKYVRELDVPFHTNYFYQQSLFSENINVAKNIFDPELDPSVRLYNHLYRKSFLESKGHSRIDQYTFLFNYRFLETYFSIPRSFAWNYEAIDTFYALIYNFPPLENMSYQIHLDRWVEKEKYLPFEKEKVLVLLNAWLQEFVDLDSFLALDLVTDPMNNSYFDILKIMIKKYFTREEIIKEVESVLSNSQNKTLVQEALDLEELKSWFTLVRK